MYLDIKNTIWERIQFDNAEQMNDVVEKLKSGELQNGSDVADYLNKGSELLEDTITELMIEDNDDFATLHVINEENNFEDVFMNGKI
jgi:hypothetical protein